MSICFCRYTALLESDSATAEVVNILSPGNPYCNVSETAALDCQKPLMLATIGLARFGQNLPIGWGSTAEDLPSIVKYQLYHDVVPWVEFSIFLTPSQGQGVV